MMRRPPHQSNKMNNDLHAELFAPTISWSNLCSIIPELAKLDQTPQDPRHHTEGDVGIHTRMCLNELRDDANWQALSPTDQYKCLLGVLMHDIAKPQRTVHEDDGTISSKGHSAAGNIQARGILWKLGVPPEIREFVCRIANYHQLPFYLESHPNRDYEMRKLSLTLPLNLLSICSRADAAGRLTTPAENRQKTFDNIDMFDLYAEDMGIWDQPMKHVSMVERGIYLEKRGAIDPSYEWPTANKRGILIAMCGLPCSGKSTTSSAWGLPTIGLDWAREELDAQHGKAKDEGQAKQLATAELKSLLGNGSSVVFDATNLEKDKRERLVATASAYMADTVFVHVETDYQTWLKQIKSRGDTSPGDKTLQGMIRRWGAPLGDEGSGQIFINDAQLVSVWGALGMTDMHDLIERAVHIAKNPMGKPI